MGSGIDDFVGRGNEAGWTALMIAAYRGDLHRIKSLIAAGAGVNVKSGGDWTAIMFAASRGEVACVEALIAAGADVNVSDRYGTTALTITSSDKVAGVLRAAGAREKPS